MPELPEVETTCRGITPHILNHTIKNVVIRNHKLRWPIPRNLPEKTIGQAVNDITRRGKYLLIHLNNGTIIMHLGMSGSLRICNLNTTPEKHDHIDFIFDNNKLLRLRDPRRFGAVLWTQKPAFQHKLLKSLGPEPLSDNFNDEYLHQISRKRTCSIKALIMNSHIVTGVGNIYACESLFLAGINPKRKAGTLTIARCTKLVNAVKEILESAIKLGGTTLKDFTRENGQPGYFSNKLNVYGNTNNACPNCSKQITQINQQGRSTFYCTTCQK